jgi:hypothetical protein
MWIHKGYFVVKKNLTVSIKAFWEKNIIG